MARFFVYPFANIGDKGTRIPDNSQASQVVSYQSGFTQRYQLVLGTDPTAIPVPRDQTNQLYFDITDNIRQYQTQGVPDWITAADNLDVSFPYGIYAVVRYDTGSGMQLWESQKNNNTSTPGANADWIVISGTGRGVPVGTIIDFAGINLPNLYIPCDNDELPRTGTYEALYNALTSVQEVTLTSASAIFTVSNAFGLYGANGDTLGMQIESSGFPAGTRILSIDGNEVTATQNATASGATDVRFFQWGAGNGTDTFNAPDFRRRVSVGQGGTSTTTIGNQVGQRGGAETVTLSTDNLPPHNHPGSTSVSSGAGGTGSFLTLNGTVGDARNYLVSAVSADAVPFPVNLSIASNPASPYSQSGTSVIQPAGVTYKLIKYA